MNLVPYAQARREPDGIGQTFRLLLAEDVRRAIVDAISEEDHFPSGAIEALDETARLYLFSIAGPRSASRAQIDDLRRRFPVP